MSALPVATHLPSAEIEPGVRTDLAGELDYRGYLALDRLLTSQRPVSDSHDELLFIVIHQTTELWLKVMVHELRAARRMIASDSLGSSFKMLARVSRIQAQLIQSWDVLSTLTPADYLVFRDRLGPASGLQSHQYRLLESLLGHKRPEMLALFPDLADKASERAWRLSGGQQQMLAIARSLVRRPRALLLDEPSLGLAPRVAQDVFRRLRAIADDGVAVLLAEQNAARALAIADEAVVLAHGSVVLSGIAARLSADDPVLTGLLAD